MRTLCEEENKHKTILFAKDRQSLDVSVDAEKEIAWRYQAEMAELFGVDRTRIVTHLKTYTNHERSQA